MTAIASGVTKFELTGGKARDAQSGSERSEQGSKVVAWLPSHLEHLLSDKRVQVADIQRLAVCRVKGDPSHGRNGQRGGMQLLSLLPRLLLPIGRRQLAKLL